MYVYIMCVPNLMNYGSNFSNRLLLKNKSAKGPGPAIVSLLEWMTFVSQDVTYQFMDY